MDFEKFSTIQPTLSADIKMYFCHLELVTLWAHFCGNRSSCGGDSGGGWRWLLRLGLYHHVVARLRGLMHTGIGENHVNLSENRGARPCGTGIFYSWRRWSLRETVRHVLGVLMLASRMHLVRGGWAGVFVLQCLSAYRVSTFPLFLPLPLSSVLFIFYLQFTLRLWT